MIGDSRLESKSSEATRVPGSQEASDEERDMALSTKPFAAEHGPGPGPRARHQGASVEHRLGATGQDSARAPGPRMSPAGSGPALCPGNELDYASTAAAMAAVHAVAIQPRRGGARLASGGLQRFTSQHPGMESRASSAQPHGQAVQQRALIRRGVLRSETEGTGVLACSGHNCFIYGFISRQCRRLPVFLSQASEPR